MVTRVIDETNLIRCVAGGCQYFIGKVYVDYRIKTSYSIIGLRQPPT